MDRSLRMVMTAWLFMSQAAWSRTDVPLLVPEYAPTAAIMISADLFAASYHAPELMQAIVRAGADVVLATNAPQSRRQLAGSLLAQGVDRATVARAYSMHVPHGNIWLRDYGPFMQSSAGDNAAAALVGFRYDDPSSTLNNQFARILAKSLRLALSERSVALDGGNLAIAGERCFTSTQERTSSNDEIVQTQLAQVGCRQIEIISEAPHAHLDMWMKVVNDRQVLVNQIDDTTVQAAIKFYGHLPRELQTLRDSLDAKAKELSSLMQVIRLPMPLPYRGSFRTYTNSILVNRTAIVPSYHRFGWNYDAYPDAELLPAIESKVRNIYQKLGYKVNFIVADGLIFNGGALHCVALPLPFVGETSIPQLIPRKGI